VGWDVGVWTPGKGGCTGVVEKGELGREGGGEKNGQRAFRTRAKKKHSDAVQEEEERKGGIHNTDKPWGRGG